MARDVPSEGFARRHRFTGQGSFGAILRSPRKLRSRHAVIHVAQGRTSASRLGIALSRRVAPSSVERNRLKRLVREVFRRHCAKSAGLDLVVAFRERFDRSQEAELMTEIRGLLDQLCRGEER